MAQEEKSVRRSNISHKVLILVVKYIPLIITLCYILNIILFKFEIDAPVLSNIAGVSLLTWVFLYLSNIVFKFCIYHRMFLYYILITDLINIYDFYFGIPISVSKLMELHGILIGLLLFSILYIHIKGYDKCNKGDITENDR